MIVLYRPASEKEWNLVTNLDTIDHVRSVALSVISTPAKASVYDFAKERPQ